MLAQRKSQFRSQRAPQQDAEKLIDPPWADLPAVVAANRQHLAGASYDLQGRSLCDLASSARRALLELALAYTRRYRDVSEPLCNAGPLDDTPFILSGHQPQLFHPGVWYKNFVLGGLARRLGGVGLHLLIDSDLCRAASIRVPTGSVDAPRVESIPYDEPAPEVPYEERAIRSAATFTSFSDRVAGALQPLARDPLVQSMWPLVMARDTAQSNLGLRLAQGRHAYEETWDNDTLELPQSLVCQLQEFAWFLAHVLAHLPRFWSAHNDALADYRRVHHIRNRAQPVPDLAQSDGWLETPFWIWSTDDPQRRSLFARQSADELILSDRRSGTLRLALTADGDAAPAVDQLLALSAQGIKIRTRALTTTLFARTMLGDLFLHGIGGAKYDQVTDQIAQQFFGMAPPLFATVSATLRLPIDHRQIDSAAERQLVRQIRDLQFHPERFIHRNGAIPRDKLAAAEAIVAEKEHWLATPKTMENASQRHAAINAANNALQAHLSELRKQWERNRQELALGKRANAILESREYSFCLFPRKHFERLLQDDPPLLP